jgi:hypothetical protein
MLMSLVRGNWPRQSARSYSDDAYKKLKLSGRNCIMGAITRCANEAVASQLDHAISRLAGSWIPSRREWVPTQSAAPPQQKRPRSSASHVATLDGNEEAMKIDLGQMFYLDMDVVAEAPSPVFFLGRRYRKFEPPTTQRLAETLER